MSKMTTDERTPLRTPFADGSKVVLGDLAVYERSMDFFRQPCWVATYRKPTPGGAARVVTFHNVEAWDKIMSEDIESGRAKLVSRGEAGCIEATAFGRHFNSNVLEPVEWCLLDREYDDDLCAVHHRERLEQLRAEAD